MPCCTLLAVGRISTRRASCLACTSMRTHTVSVLVLGSSLPKPISVRTCSGVSILDPSAVSGVCRSAPEKLWSSSQQFAAIRSGLAQLGIRQDHIFFLQEPRLSWSGRLYKVAGSRPMMRVSESSMELRLASPVLLSFVNRS